MSAREPRSSRGEGLRLRAYRPRSTPAATATANPSRGGQDVCRPHSQDGCAPLMRPRAIENVWNSYVLQLCVVNCFSRGCYDARCPRLRAARRLLLRLYSESSLSAAADRTNYFYHTRSSQWHTYVYDFGFDETQYTELARRLLYSEVQP